LGRRGEGVAFMVYGSDFQVYVAVEVLDLAVLLQCTARTSCVTRCPTECTDRIGDVELRVAGFGLWVSGFGL